MRGSNSIYPPHGAFKYDDVVISRTGSVGFSCLVNKPEKSVFASY